MPRGTNEAGAGPATGYFGKFPTLGDFVSRNLPRDTVNNLDEWLRHAVRESQRALGRAWLDAFLVAPVWRGLVAPGLLGRDAMALVMMPSVDRVGRYFPLVIAAPLAGHRGPLPPLKDHLANWFARAESLALSTLTPDFDRSRMDAELDSLHATHWFEPQLRGGAHDDRRSLWWVGADPKTVRGFDALPEPETFHEIFLSVETHPTHEIAPPSAGPSPAAVTPPPAETRVLLDIESEGSALKGTRSAILTDAIAIGQDSQAMSVVSGIGTHPNLRSAIDVVRDTLGAIANPFSMNDLVAEAKGKLGRANALLQARGIPSGTTFAASCVTLLVQGNRHAILWSGNARGYLYRGGTLTRLTRDHVDPTLPGVITRAVGGDVRLSIESGIGEARAGDVFLLCSTGLISVTPEEEIAEVLSSATSARQTSAHLTQNAMISGAALDVSALVAILRRKGQESPASTPETRSRTE